mgnify:CR=1 FL=1
MSEKASSEEEKYFYLFFAPFKTSSSIVSTSIFKKLHFFLLDSIKKIFETPKIDKTAPGKPAPEPKSTMFPFKFLQ